VTLISMDNDFEGKINQGKEPRQHGI